MLLSASSPASAHSAHSVQVSSPRSTLGSGQAHSGSNTYLNLHEILAQPKDFALPTLGPKLAAIKQEIVAGRGFKLIRWVSPGRRLTCLTSRPEGNSQSRAAHVSIA